MNNRTAKVRYIEMTGPTVQMDRLGDGYEPANSLPIRCPHCSFPDLDFVPRPYLLTKGTASPAETGLAVRGNFLVRERVRKILELVVPGACSFHPTAERSTKAVASWWLAVPQAKMDLKIVKAKGPFCPKCKEPKIWGFPVKELEKAVREFDAGKVDVLKSSWWNSFGDTAEEDFAATNLERQADGTPLLKWSDYKLTPPPHPGRWTRQRISLELYFSVRLEQLLKRAKVKGQLGRLLTFNDVKPSAEDLAWVEEKFKLLEANGLVATTATAAPKANSPALKWFKQYLKRKANPAAKPADFAAVEAKRKLTLPASYKEYISAVGSESFKNVNGLEVTFTTILPPAKLDFKNFRAGQVQYLEGDDAKVDGVMFASTDFGDCYVFDVSVKGDEYPIYWYRHEENTMEVYAPNFAECLKRFTQKN